MVGAEDMVGEAEKIYELRRAKYDLARANFNREIENIPEKSKYVKRDRLHVSHPESSNRGDK